jgi:hypothetical protein
MVLRLYDLKYRRQIMQNIIVKLFLDTFTGASELAYG